MRTSKPVSTISFNTAGFLSLKLEELVDSKIVSVWYYIAHDGEDDEGGKKDHSHLYIEPSKLIQTDDLVDHFKERDPRNKKPLGCLRFYNSKFAHWYLYAIHDKDYLDSVKGGMKKKYCYCYDDIMASNYDELYRAVGEIDHNILAPVNLLRKAKEDGITFSHLVSTGRIPLQQIRNWEEAYKMIEMGVGGRR